MASIAAGRGVVSLTRFRLPKLVLARFIAGRTVKSGLLWGIVSGLYVYDNAFAFKSIAPTVAKRDSLLNAMAANTGLKALLGETRRISTIGGFTDWRALGVTILVASIWGLLVATRYLRGEEAAGRWELFLSGQTTGRRAAVNALAGLAVGVLAMYLPAAALTVAVGARPDVGIGVGPSLLFAVALVSGAAMFAAIGALASEVMPTKARATGLAAGVFAVSFTLRAISDTAPSAHWLGYLSPLGWVEALRPLAGPQPLWLLPIAGLVGLCAAGAVLVADRDLGTALLADKDARRPRTALLGSSGLMTLRLSWASITGWLAAALLAGALYGSFAKTAGRAFSSSNLIREFTGSLADVVARQLEIEGARVYAGIVFLILMTLAMAYVASALGRAREEEAEGYLDNLLVREVSRSRWLASYIGLVLIVVLLAATLGGFGFWIGAVTQHAGLTFHELMLAGVNAAAPAIALAGIGVAVFGFAPRLTSVACWGVLAWAFLIDMLGSAVKVNHWIMDTSLLRHMALAPAVHPDWAIAGIYAAIGCAAALAGLYRFTRRDLASS